jgi:hypothetical protein
MSMPAPSSRQPYYPPRRSNGCLWGCLCGALRWRLNTGDRIYTTPAIGDDGTLYLGTEALVVACQAAHGQ